MGILKKATKNDIKEPINPNDGLTVNVNVNGDEKQNKAEKLPSYDDMNKKNKKKNIITEDFILYQVLEENGYAPSEENLEIFKTLLTEECEGCEDYFESFKLLIEDEKEAIAGYEKSIKLFEGSDIACKDEIIAQLIHIKDEEKEHIEELEGLVDKLNNCGKEGE